MHMKKLFGMLALVTVMSAGAFAAEIVLGPGLGTPSRTVFHQSGSLTLSADNTYILTGLYFVDSTFSLTIPAGTVIKGDSAATLIISRGATITAQGTSTNPIIFTSLRKTGSRGRGNWGGIILLGNAPTNQTNPVIEGGIIPGSYGGGNPADNSGIVEYVRIEFPGYRFQTNNEVNGLTMGGVGSGTTVRYVQVSFSDDDSYEWFGGTVNGKYLVAYGGTDDEFDTDFGYQGRVQFGFGMKDPDTWDPTGETNGFESDNEGSASYKNPRTLALFSNVTLVGMKRVDSVAARTGNKFQYNAVLRRGTQESIYNSVLFGWPGGVSVRDQQSYGAAIGDTLQVRNTSIAAFDGVTFPVVHGQNGPTPAQVSAWFNTPAYSNLGGTAVRSMSSLGLTDMNLLNDPNPIPAAGSELIGSADFTNPRLSSGFDVVTYRGAFNPAQSLEQQWTAGWTNFNPQYSTVDVEAGWNMVAVPAVTPSSDPNVVYPGQSGVAFAWSNGGGGSYSAAATITPGVGYWVKYPGKRTVPFSGRTINSVVTVPAAEAGWVLVGGLSKPVTSISASGAGSITGLQFKWDAAVQGYVAVDLTASGADDLLPGESAWVKVTGACTLTLNQ
jgi:hypothetical protein